MLRREFLPVLAVPFTGGLALAATESKVEGIIRKIKEEVSRFKHIPKEDVKLMFNHISLKEEVIFISGYVGSRLNGQMLFSAYPVYNGDKLTDQDYNYLEKWWLRYRLN